MTEPYPKLSAYCQDREFVSAYSLGPAVWSSLLMAVGSMGDAFLYAYLPVKGEALGLSLLSIGVLLSVNKFTRFFTNRWIAWLTYRWGVKPVLLGGLLLSAFATFTYGLNPALWIWILSRIAWGAAFSALRFATIRYADQCSAPGSALGIGRSIQEAGPFAAYLLGPPLLHTFGASLTFTIWTLMLLALTPVFRLLPDPSATLQKIRPLTFQWPTWLDVWMFVGSFAVEGLLIVGLSKLLLPEPGDKDQVILLTALFISLRRLLNMLISPAAGWLSDKTGVRKLFLFSGLLTAVGFIVIGYAANQTGILLSYTGFAINQTLIPLVALQAGPSTQSYEALTRITTSRDMGSATGVLTGLSILNLADHQLIFVALAVLTVLIWFKIYRLKSSNE